MSDLAPVTSDTCFTTTSSGSDSVGGKWGGLRGSFFGSVTLGISSAAGLTVDPKVRVSADVGAGGRWNGLGSYDADTDFWP